tara:strand:- start:859 stop:1710 length:852 start_codon:yes stop_codon:yes gene_type:complete
MKKCSTFILLLVCTLFIKSSPIFSADKLLVGVLGASGRTGVHIIDELKQRDVDIRAFSRRIEAIDDTPSQSWVFADVTDQESLNEAFKDVDIIISAIGAVGEDTSETVDYYGTINIVAAAKKNNVKHIIYMSSIGAGGAENISTVILNLFADKTMKWKALAEEEIRNSGISFTIVRPGGLVGEPSSQGIKFSQGDKLLGWIPREDVAAVLVESIFKDGAKNKTFEVINDESLPVDAWRNGFDSLEPNQFGVIASGELPTRYWLMPLLALIAIIYLIRRRRARN